MKLNPAVRTGLIWAGVHQAWALIGFVGMWVHEGLFYGPSIVLVFTDYPVVLLMTSVELRRHYAQLASLQKLLPDMDGANSIELILAVLTLGAAQWFLIGCAVGVWNAKSETREPQNLA